nr:MAG TPA: hypothetical protein [Caudoviricetes sp.]
MYQKTVPNRSGFFHSNIKGFSSPLSKYISGNVFKRSVIDEVV